MDLFDRLAFYTIILSVLSLIPLSYVDLLKKNIKSNERVYISGNFEYNKVRDPLDKSSEALYWHIQLVDLDRTR